MRSRLKIVGLLAILLVALALPMNLVRDRTTASLDVDDPSASRFAILSSIDSSWLGGGGSDPAPVKDDIVLPDLEPWGLVFVGGRRIVAEGKPAFQFTYTTDNKELGPITLFVTSSAEPDIEPSFEKRDTVNLLHWRHRGHGYYIVGDANKGWMWGLKNDIAYQLKAL